MTQTISKLSIAMLLILTFMSMNTYSQNQTKKKKMFVRVYDFEGEKMAKGHFHYATDSILELKKGEKLASIPIEEISYIKTKRANGHNMLVHTLIGATIGAVIGAATAEPDKELGGYSAGEGALTLGVISAIFGAGVGGITIALKKTTMYIIDGDIENWKLIKENIK